MVFHHYLIDVTEAQLVGNGYLNILGAHSKDTTAIKVMILHQIDHKLVWRYFGAQLLITSSGDFSTTVLLYAMQEAD